MRKYHFLSIVAGVAGILILVFFLNCSSSKGSKKTEDGGATGKQASQPKERPKAPPPEQKHWKQVMAEQHKNCKFMGADDPTHPNFFYSPELGYHHEGHHEECEKMEKKFGQGDKWYHPDYGVHIFGHEEEIKYGRQSD